jgi:glycogen debranching enzyme
MAGYSLQMLRVAVELARHKPVYQDMASKFLEHFLRVAAAMTNIGGNGASLWNEEDGFFYDLLHLQDGSIVPLKVRSLVGLIPLIAVDTFEGETLNALPDLKRRMIWFFTHRPHLSGNIARMDVPGRASRRLAALVDREKLQRILSRMFDEEEFLSEYGLRSLSKYHEKHPYRLNIGQDSYEIGFEPGESLNGMFGGNSNWRGPVWFPTNFLLIEALQRFHHYYGEEFTVEYPTGSGVRLNLDQIAKDLSLRLIKLFQKRPDGSRPFYGPHPLFRDDKSFERLFLFNEYYHSETGEGLGASHQTGWTSLVAKLLQQCGDNAL